MSEGLARIRNRGSGGLYRFQGRGIKRDSPFGSKYHLIGIVQVLDIPTQKENARVPEPVYVKPAWRES